MLLVVIIMFYNVLWGFSIEPPCFMGIFHRTSLFLFYNVSPGREEVNEMRPNGQTRQVAWVPGQAVPPYLVWASSLRCRPSSSLDAQPDLKMPI
jgi:hypothetical protein